MLWSIGDIYIALVIFSIIGHFCPKVHNYSLYFIVIFRAVWVLVQFEMIVRNYEIVQKQYDISFLSSDSMIRVVTPCCMLFLSRFKLYL